MALLLPALTAHPESALLLWQVLLPPLSSLEVRGTPEYEEVVRKDKDGNDQTQRVLVWNVSGALLLCCSDAPTCMLIACAVSEHQSRSNRS